MALFTRSIGLPRFISAKRIQSAALCSGLTDSYQNALRKLLVSAMYGGSSVAPALVQGANVVVSVTRPGKVRAQQPYGTMSEYSQTVSKAGA